MALEHIFCHGNTVLWGRALKIELWGLSLTQTVTPNIQALLLNLFRLRLQLKNIGNMGFFLESHPKILILGSGNGDGFTYISSDCNRGSIMVQWLTLLPQSKKVLFGVFLCRVCMFFSYLHGNPPVTSVSSNCLKTWCEAASRPRPPLNLISGGFARLKKVIKSKKKKDNQKIWVQ